MLGRGRRHSGDDSASGRKPLHSPPGKGHAMTAKKDPRANQVADTRRQHPAKPSAEPGAIFRDGIVSALAGALKVGAEVPGRRRKTGQPGLCVNTGAPLTPTLSLAEGEGAGSIPSPPEGERVRVRGGPDAGHAFMNSSG